MNQNKQISTKLLVLTSALTAMVVVLQLLGSFIRFGMFSISLVLIPIVIGAALCGTGAGAWLGLAFGITVLISGDAAAFLAVDPFGTVLTVLVKGTAAGYLAGLIYKVFAGLCPGELIMKSDELQSRQVLAVIWPSLPLSLSLLQHPDIASPALPGHCHGGALPTSQDGLPIRGEPALQGNLPLKKTRTLLRSWSC